MDRMSKGLGSEETMEQDACHLVLLCQVGSVVLPRSALVRLGSGGNATQGPGHGLGAHVTVPGWGFGLGL